MPEVEKDLIAPGKVRFVYHDFPLDQVALTAAMVARYLPPAQYYPFVTRCSPTRIAGPSPAASTPPTRSGSWRRWRA